MFCLVTLETLLRLCEMLLKSGYEGQGRASVAWLMSSEKGAKAIETTEATEACLEATEKWLQASEVWLGIPEAWLGILEALLEEPGNWT